MARERGGLKKLAGEIPVLHEEFRKNTCLTGHANGINAMLEQAMRVDDFFELAQLICADALDRDESCGGHFRVEHQTPDGEAKRDDARFAHVSAWEHRAGGAPVLHKEPLVYEETVMSGRNYK